MSVVTPVVPVHHGSERAQTVLPAGRAPLLADLSTFPAMEAGITKPRAQCQLFPLRFLPFCSA
ncbi:hypothetical protein ApDm4_0786 [Acetobacter pomorum]|nr:hypothetical protein ApDm4_0786 [Acetobacter pomorum]